MFKKASEVQLADPQVEVREQPFQILHGAVEQPRQGTGDDRAELPAGEERDQHARDAGEDHRDDRPRDVERTRHGLEGRSLRGHSGEDGGGQEVRRGAVFHD